MFCSAPLIIENGRHWTVSRLNAFDFLSEEYQQLFARADATIFQSPVWLDRIYGTLAPRFDACPMIITIRARDSGRLVAVLPLSLRRFRGIRVAAFADFGVADYCAVVVASGDLALLLGDSEVPTLVRNALRGCDVLSVRKVRAQELPGFDLIGRVVRSKAELRAHASTLLPDFEAWLQESMDPTQRRSLERKRRKLHAKGALHLDIAESGDDIATALANLRKFRAHRFRSRDAQDLLSDDVVARFYDEVAEHGSSARAYTLRVDDTPTSIAFGIARAGTFHMLLSGFNADYRNYSVGLLVIQDAIRDCIARGEDTFDLTIGDQPYKQSFGTVETGIWSVWSGISFAGRSLAHVLARSPRALKLARRII